MQLFTPIGQKVLLFIQKNCIFAILYTFILCIYIFTNFLPMFCILVINFVMIMNIWDSDILKMKFDQPVPKVGDLLLAEPLMKDITFQRSVVVLVEHSDTFGTMGFVTNRCSNFDLEEIVEGIECDEEIPVYIGGPVHRDRLYYIHTLGNLIPDSLEVSRGLYVSGDFKAMIEYINSGAPVEGHVRFFLGYSGWEKGQLENELKNFDWAVTKMREPERLLTLDEEDAWRAEVSELDERYLLWLNCPASVILN